MTIERLNEMIDDALTEGMENNLYMRTTNTINASHALGKYHALLQVINEDYGIDEMIKTYERTQAKAELLLGVSNKSYARGYRQ